MLYQRRGSDDEGATAIAQGWRLAHRPLEPPELGSGDTDVHLCVRRIRPECPKMHGGDYRTRSGSSAASIAGIDRAA